MLDKALKDIFIVLIDFRTKSQYKSNEVLD